MFCSVACTGQCAVCIWMKTWHTLTRLSKNSLDYLSSFRVIFRCPNPQNALTLIEYRFSRAGNSWCPTPQHAPYLSLYQKNSIIFDLYLKLPNVQAKAASPETGILMEINKLVHWILAQDLWISPDICNDHYTSCLAEYHVTVSGPI